MATVAVFGAGDIGAACAQALASRDCARRIVLIDSAASASTGKALDIQQMGPIDGFHTRLDGTDDPSRATGCAICVVAYRFGKTAVEWQGDEGLAMLARLVPALGDALVTVKQFGYKLLEQPPAV